MNKPILEQCRAWQGNKVIDYYDVSIPQNTYSPQPYECLSHSILTQNGIHTESNVQSRVIWSVEKSEQKGEYQVFMKMLDCETESPSRDLMEFEDLAYLFTIPTQEILCSLKKNGEVKNVLNQNDIYQRWREVYQRLVEEWGENELLEQVEQVGDNEFSQPLVIVRKNLLHNLLLLPLFDIRFTYGTQSSFAVRDNSHLLNGETLDFFVKEKSIEVESNLLKLKLAGNLQDANWYLQKAKTLFSSYPVTPQSYETSLTVDYHLDAFEGYPVWIEANLQEGIPGILTFNQQIKIKRLAADSFLE